MCLLSPPTWRVRHLRTGWEWTDRLEAYWEVEQDWISDDYMPEDIDAESLFRLWTKAVSSQYPNRLIPIHWFVRCPAQGVFEWMPYQFRHASSNEEQKNFLDYYSCPVKKLFVNVS